MATSYENIGLIQMESATTTEESSVKFPDAFVQLSGEDGNAGSIMGRVTRELASVGASKDDIAQFRAECISGDYDNLLRTVMRWVETA